MAKFEEAAKDSCPVLHTRRSDGVVIIATRVPLGDIRLQKWGWILALSNKNELTEDDILTLTDNAGKRYPKVYRLEEVQNYAEPWGCIDWEEGYEDDVIIPFLSKSQVLPNEEREIERTRAFQQALSELQIHQQEQLETFQQELKILYTLKSGSLNFWRPCF